MPDSPLVYKKAQIDGVTTLIKEEGFLSSAMRRSSPRQPATASDPRPTLDAQEVSGLLANTPSVQERGPKVETEEVAVSGVSCRQISTRKRDAAAVDGSGGDVAPVDIEVPLLAALVETHAANIAAAE